MMLAVDEPYNYYIQLANWNIYRESICELMKMKQSNQIQFLYQHKFVSRLCDAPTYTN